jgi:hypothetical protein
VHLIDRREEIEMAAQTVLEELTEDDLTLDHVRRRVDDWADRIEQLYTTIGGWLPSGWTARRGAHVIMDEEVMRTVGVPARDLPSLDLLHDGNAEVNIRPRGLWIIGTNGRIDLIKGDDVYLIRDHAKTFESPDWHIAAPTERQNSRPFDKRRLEALLVA